MTTQASDAKWMPLTPEGEALIEASVYRQANDIASMYGAKPIAMPNRFAPTRYKLLTAGAVSRLSGIKWRIKGVIPESGVAAIFGPSGSGKSFLALDLAMSVAKGTSWFGHRTKDCPVVYVCLEGEAGLSNRVNAYKTTAQSGGKVHFLTQSCSLLVSRDVKDLAEAILEQQAAEGVVVIDTLNRAAPGMDENSSADMGKVIAATKTLQNLVGGLVMLVHHTGKDAAKGMRGHSSLFAALDAAIEVKRTGDLREWSIAKSKDGEDGKAHQFKLHVVCMGMDDDGDLISSCVINPVEGSGARLEKPLSTAQRQGMESFMAAASASIGANNRTVQAHVDQWRIEFNRLSTADNPEAKRKAFNRVRGQLVEMGKLIVRNDVYQLPNGYGDPSGLGT